MSGAPKNWFCAIEFGAKTQQAERFNVTRLFGLMYKQCVSTCMYLSNKYFRRHGGTRLPATRRFWVWFALLAIVHSLSAQSASGGASSRAIQLPLSARQSAGTSVQQSVAIPSGSSISVQVQTQGAYSGSVPDADAREGRVAMSLSEAVQRGLRTNLGMVNAGNGELQAQAQKNLARGALLPNVNVSASEAVIKLNLAAQGFSASAFGASLPFQFPTTVGPFHYYDLHGSV